MDGGGASLNYHSDGFAFIASNGLAERGITLPAWASVGLEGIVVSPVTAVAVRAPVRVPRTISLGVIGLWRGRRRRCNGWRAKRQWRGQQNRRWDLRHSGRLAYQHKPHRDERREVFHRGNHSYSPALSRAMLLRISAGLMPLAAKLQIGLVAVPTLKPSGNLAKPKAPGAHPAVDAHPITLDRPGDGQRKR